MLSYNPFNNFECLIIYRATQIRLTLVKLFQLFRITPSDAICPGPPASAAVCTRDSGGNSLCYEYFKRQPSVSPLSNRIEKRQ